jgi:hypothetical protein
VEESQSLAEVTLRLHRLSDTVNLHHAILTTERERLAPGSRGDQPQHRGAQQKRVARLESTELRSIITSSQLNVSSWTLLHRELSKLGRQIQAFSTSLQKPRLAHDFSTRNHILRFGYPHLLVSIMVISIHYARCTHK